MGLFLLVLFLIASSGGVPCVDAWGDDGHFMVCKIAEPLLKNNTLVGVRDVLPKAANGDLASVCSWADKVRLRYRWASPLHYVNTPKGACNFQYQRDCLNPQGDLDMCVVGAINNYTKQLHDSMKHQRSPCKSYLDFLRFMEQSDNLTESLMFLSHFMGDVHQPLHVGFKEDEGGNTIRVKWFGNKSNLHRVWDSDIIKRAIKVLYRDNRNHMIDAIRGNLTEDEIADWKRCSGNLVTCPDKYADESARLACDFAYKDAPPKSKMEQEKYFSSRLPIIQERIAQAALRLASVLDTIFARVYSKKERQGYCHSIDPLTESIQGMCINYPY